MPNLNDEFRSSEWIKASDLKGRRVNCRINDVTIETDREGKKQVVLHFETKKFGLNVTNRRMCQKLLGDDTDAWIGRLITLRPDTTPNPQGTIVDCIRVDYELPDERQPPQQPRSVAATALVNNVMRPAPATNADSDWDDENPVF